MTDDLISRQEAIELCDWYEHEFCECDYVIKALADDLKSLPTAIIYCGECAHMMPDGRCRQFADSSIFPSASDFCSAAERIKDDGRLD